MNIETKLMIATGLCGVFEVQGGAQILYLYPEGAQRLWGWSGIIVGPITILYSILRKPGIK